MKSIKIFFTFLVIVIIGAVVACNKEAINQSANSNGNILSALQANNLKASACDQFAYADTIFFPAQLPDDYIVKPLKQLAGTYGAFPEGLKINATNGNINISKSETGLEYIVWFIPQGTTDTCTKFITLSGINYTDSIYVLANNPGTAKPVYNANTQAPVDCSGGCEFDDGPDDDNGNGISDEPLPGQEVIPQGMAINKSTGVIDFKKSLRNGMFGSNPVSGTYKNFVLNYRIGDKSSKALNRIRLRIYYYKTQSEIPAELKQTLTDKQGQVLLEDEDEDDDGGHHHGHGGGGNNLSSINLTGSITTSKHGQGEVKCRPPYIIVTQK